MDNETSSKPVEEFRKETNFQSALNQSGLDVPKMDAKGSLYISAVMDYVTSVAIKRSAQLLCEESLEGSLSRKKRRLEPEQIERALAGNDDLNPMVSSRSGSSISFSKLTICIDGDPCSGKTELVKALCKQMVENKQYSESRQCLENLCPTVVSEFYRNPQSFNAFQVHALTSMTNALAMRKLSPRMCLLLDRGSMSLDALAFHFVAKKHISAQQFHFLRKLQKHCVSGLNIDLTIYIFEECPSKTHEAITRRYRDVQLKLSDIKSINDLRFELLLRCIAAAKRKIVFLRRELISVEDCLSMIRSVIQGSVRPPWVRYNPGFLSQEEHTSKSRLVYSTIEQLQGAVSGIERTSTIQSRIADTVYFHVNLWNHKREFKMVCLYHLARFEDICLYKCPGEDLDPRTSSVVKFLWPSHK